jgi:hypothetical protein
MKIENRNLVLTRKELVDLIQNENPDKSNENNFFTNTLLSIVKYQVNFSDKQYKWILSKVTYIINHNKKYTNFRKKFKDFILDVWGKWNEFL